MDGDRGLSGAHAFFGHSLGLSDPELARAIGLEAERQQQHIELIASENIVSRAVLEAQGSILTNKYAEGYPGKRYYGGCAFIDLAENLAIERAKALFRCNYANVQPHSGSQANQGVFLALMQPGDVFLGMGLDAGGHLTHGAAPNQSGKWFRPVHYGVRRADHRIDLDQVRDLAREHRPKMILAGGSAYSRIIDFAAFRQIADEVGAYFMVDMAHFAGLVAGGVYPNPLDHAHVVTTTTHKTLRGPRGGMILTNEADLAKKFNSAIFPGLQGGPLMHVIAAKAAAFGEALSPEFRVYCQAVIENAAAMAQACVDGGLAVASGGTDTHLALIDLRPKGVTGAQAEAALERCYITCNKNSVPFDTQKPTITSGIRIGSPACTTRGFDRHAFEEVARLILETVEMLAAHPEGEPSREAEIRARAKALTARFPIYEALGVA